MLCGGMPTSTPPPAVRTGESWILPSYLPPPPHTLPLCRAIQRPSPYRAHTLPVVDRRNKQVAPVRTAASLPSLIYSPALQWHLMGYSRRLALCRLPTFSSPTAVAARRWQRAGPPPGQGLQRSCLTEVSSTVQLGSHRLSPYPPPPTLRATAWLPNPHLPYSSAPAWFAMAASPWRGSRACASRMLV